MEKGITVDKSHISSRAPSYQNSFSGSATTNTAGGFGSVGIPLTPHREFGVDGPSATEEEFKARAKAHKKAQTKTKIVKKLIILTIILGVIIMILGAIGLALNQRYAGRALPYSYMGDMSIGGLTAAEIKTALDLRAAEATVTFTEGGLTRTVPADMFSTNFDTEKASQDAMVGFNPFKFLTLRNFSVPVQVDPNQVDGYLNLYVADKQTSNENARLIKGDEGLVIAPEVTGYRTSTAYVVEQLEKQFKELKDPVVSLSAATERPQITAEDLKDDLEKANTMVATDVALQVWSSKVSPSLEDKLGWLDIKEVQGTSDVIVDFSQTKVREYIFGLADKYTFDKEDEVIAVNEDGGQYIKAGKKGQKVKNIDAIAAKFYQALNSQQNGLFAFEFDYTEYQKIDPASVNLIKAPEKPVAVEPDEPIIEDDTEAQDTQSGEQDIITPASQNNSTGQ